MSRLIYVEWSDSAGIDSIWQFKDDWELTSHKCKSVGFVVSVNRDELVICQSENTSQYGHLFVIPKSSITLKKELSL